MQTAANGSQRDKDGAAAVDQRRRMHPRQGVWSCSGWRQRGIGVGAAGGGARGAVGDGSGWKRACAELLERERRARSKPGGASVEFGEVAVVGQKN